MIFLCDHMVEGLGRWLRIAGYDTAIIEGSECDEMIHKRALQERRKLITCDHHFLKMEIPDGQLIFLTGNSMEEWVKQMKVDWLYKPFSRCLICNTTLVEADPQIILEQAPPNPHPHYKYCAVCKKLFWEGSHTETMRKQLAVWQKLS